MLHLWLEFRNKLKSIYTQKSQISNECPDGSKYYSLKIFDQNNTSIEYISNSDECYEQYANTISYSDAYELYTMIDEFSDKENRQTIEGNSWKLIAYGNQKYAEENNITYVDNQNFSTLQFQNNSINGTVFCNSFLSSYAINKRIEISNLNLTKIECVPMLEEQHKVSVLIQSILKQHTKFQIHENNLTLQSYPNKSLNYWEFLTYTFN